MPIAHRLAAAALIGTSGTLVVLSMLNEWPFVVAAALGAIASGYLFASWFGMPGWQGVGFCVLGAFLTTTTGAALAGLGLGLVIAMNPAGLLFGPMAVGQALLTSPLTLLTWIGSMAVAHLMMRQVRTPLPIPS